jgi:phospholipase C
MLRRLAIIALSLCLAQHAQARVPQIQHIIIVVQENRSVDNLFHGLDKILPTVDIANSGLNSKGQTIQLQPGNMSAPYTPDHSHTAFVSMYDGGKMDGADKVACFKTWGPCPANPSYFYVRPGQVAPYFEIAENYGFANRMFQSNQGPSFPAHQFLFAGTSQPEANSPLFASSNPIGGTGCLAPLDAYVLTVDPAGKEGNKIYPCFEHQTLADLLDAPPKTPTSPISWRYYTIAAENIWSAPDAIEHLCQPGASPTRCTSPHWSNGDIVLWPPQVLLDIHRKALPSVSWVIPTGQDSDHPAITTGGGPSWVASIVNAVGNSTYWTNTVILVTWDDWGGWYDHVKPPIDPTYGYYEEGFRVPLLVVSAYTPKAYVSQRKHDFGSILRFVESVFDLGLIPPGNFADARADNLSDFFEFSKPARKYTPIRQSMPESHFLDRRRRMTPPDND